MGHAHHVLVGVSELGQGESQLGGLVVHVLPTLTTPVSGKLIEEKSIMSSMPSTSPGAICQLSDSGGVGYPREARGEGVLMDKVECGSNKGVDMETGGVNPWGDNGTVIGVRGACWVSMLWTTRCSKALMSTLTFFPRFTL